MWKKNRKKCTREVVGTIVKMDRKSMEMPTMITVEYVVDEVKYTVKESVKLKSKLIKIGFLPIGQVKTPRMGDIVVGGTAAVCYNPEQPEKAYIKENVGSMNG
jgi:hypothetical protein